MRARTRGCLLLLMALAACATPAGNTPLSLEHTTPLRPALAAWLTAATLRHELMAADPLPGHRGVPVFALPGDAFRVLAALGGDQRWHLLGNGRLLAVAGPDLAAAGGTTFAPCRFLPRSAPLDTAVAIEIHVTPVPGGGARVSGTGTIARADQVLRHFTSVMDRAESLLQSGAEGERGLGRAARTASCCDAHACLRVALLAAEARRLATAERPRDAAALLAQGRALAPGLPSLDLAAGTLLADLGQHLAAVTALRGAGRDHDLDRRHAAGRSRRELLPFQSIEAGAALRLAMAQQLDRGDAARAAGLLHSAEATDPDPPSDLLLTARLHAIGNQPQGQLGCLLLRTLHTQDDCEPGLSRALLAAGHPTLAMRQLARRRLGGVAAADDQDLLDSLTSILGDGLCDRIALDARGAGVDLELPEPWPTLARPQGETSVPVWRRAAALRYGPPRELSQ